MKTTISTECPAPLATLITDLESVEVAIARTLNGLRGGTLGCDPVFVASCEARNIGPANDWDGQRSRALWWVRRWDEQVLTPARLKLSLTA